MYQNLGKKVIIFAHSFGNYQTVHNLTKMTQADKDKMVARYVALGPPYIGATATTRMIFSLDNMFSEDIKVTEVGITGPMFKQTVALMKGLYNLMPKDTFRVLKDRPFMQAIHARIDAEKHGYNIITNTVLDLLPGVLETCMPGFTSRDQFCKFSFVDLTTFGEITGTPMTHDTIEDLFEQYGCIDGAKEIYESVKSPLFEELTNPGVQTNVVFSSTLSTLYQIQYEENPKLKTSNNRYVAPTNETHAYGDGRVLNTSAIVAALKWAEDFQQGQPGAKPINIIETCSVWKRRTSVFEPGTKSVDNNAYFGYDCDCGGTIQNPSDGGGCQHVPFISDPKFVRFMLESAMDGVPQIQSSTTQSFEDQSEEELSQYENQCLLINNN